MPKKGVSHFEISERKLLLRIIDLILVSLSIIGLSFVFENNYIYNSEQFWQWLICYLVYFIFFATVFELYVLNKVESRFTVLKNVFICLSFTNLAYLLTPYITPVLPNNRFDILIVFVSNFVVLILWRFSYITFITAPRFYKRVIFVGENFDINEIAKELRVIDENYEIVAHLDSSSNQLTVKGVSTYNLNDLIEVIESEGIGEIVVADSFRGVNQELLYELTQVLKTGIPIVPYSSVYEGITKRILLKDVSNNFYCYFPIGRSNQNTFYLFFSRSLDIFSSILGISVLLFVIPFVLVVNLFYNKGPLFYFQKRVGKFSIPFEIFKFRTMVTNAESKGAQWSEKNDVRITAFGKLLRAFRIDELPQFINILKGDMSLIGPRPERPEFERELIKNIPFYETRHIIKPGLTGWAQVNARYASSESQVIEKLQYDLYYIKQRSISLDFRIVVKTMSTIIFFRGQ